MNLHPLPAYDKIEAELKNWIDGEVVTRRADQYGTTIVVTKSPDGYTVIRAFTIGDGAGVSLDLQNATADETIDHLLKAFG
jgi:hypothetical protein